MKNPLAMITLLGMLSGVCGTLSMASSEGFAGFSAIAPLPPGEQFRQLSLMLLMTARAGPEFTQLLATELDSLPSWAIPDRPSGGIMPDDYRTPLVRIVDQESMVDGAVHLFEFVQQNLGSITDLLQAIKVGNPVLISLVDTNALMEDAVIIRNAIADSVVYLDHGESGRMGELLAEYRVHTVFLRNQVEYAEFYEQLIKITNEAVNSVGGKMDAYQRMFDEEFETASVKRFLEASEFNREKRARFDRRAAQLTEEILQNVMDAMNPAKP